MRLQVQQQRHIALWQNRLDHSQQEETKRQKAWDERHELLTTQHLEVMAEFEARLHQAEAAPPSVGDGSLSTDLASGLSAPSTPVVHPLR